MSSPSADLSYIICIFRYAWHIISPLIHIAIGVFHYYYWLIYILLDSIAPCPVDASLKAMYSYITGTTPSVLDLCPMKDRQQLISFTTDSLRALGRQDVLRLRQSFSALAAFALDACWIGCTILWPVTEPNPAASLPVPESDSI